MSEASTPDVNTQVSHEQNGRVLTGVGVEAEKLAETMERHAPPEPEPTAATETAPPSTPEPAAPAAPKLTRGQKRFSELTSERDAAKAEADAAKAEREAAIRERDELKAKFAQPAAAPAVQEPPKEPAKVEPTRPEPQEEEIGTKYQNYREFVRDMAAWVLEQERAQSNGTTEQRVREILAAERHHAEVATAVQSARERGRKAYADFDTLLNGPTGAIDLGRTKEESVQRVLFIAQHPQSEHIQYAILKDEALARKLGASDPVTFGMTIAGLVTAPAAKPEKTWTPPPSPHPTVGASSPTTAPSSAELAKKGDYEAYRQRRAAERGVTRRR